KEIKGTRHSQRILKYAKESGFGWVSEDETAWCSIFMNWVAKKASLKHSGKANARSWLNVGQAVNIPEPGDVVVYWREAINSWKGHVGIFMGFSANGERIYTLGGNQKDSVCITAYSADKLLGFRRLKPKRKFSLPKPVLKRGSKGVEVAKLQDVLKLLDFDAGTSDGDFGPKTERAVSLLQSTSSAVSLNGKYDKATSQLIEDLLEDKD
ncbi:MAG: TIGR02594 family protein, partial [Flavobacteriales bacterium]